MLIVPLYSGPVKMLVTPPCGASSNIALMRAIIKPPVELVVDDLKHLYIFLFTTVADVMKSILL